MFGKESENPLYILNLFNFQKPDNPVLILNLIKNEKSFHSALILNLIYMFIVYLTYLN